MLTVIEYLECYLEGVLVLHNKIAESSENNDVLYILSIHNHLDIDFRQGVWSPLVYIEKFS